MNSTSIQYIIYLCTKFSPIIIIVSFYDFTYGDVKSFGQLSFGMILYTIILIVSQIFLYRIQNINYDEDRFEIIEWNKHQIFPWLGAERFNVYDTTGMRFGRIVMKGNKRPIFFIQYGSYARYNFFQKKQSGLNKNLDIVERIKFKYSI